MLAPGRRPVGIGQRRQARTRPRREAELPQARHVGVDTDGERIGGLGHREERAEASGAGEQRFLDHANRALLPEEIGQRLGGIIADVDHDLDVGGKPPGECRHPRSFFMRSRNEVASGPLSFEAASKASSASRCLALSFCGTSSRRR